jgi:predicted phosphodiesterase
VAKHLFAAAVILHAGDVCVASVLKELSAYAPVHAVVGNTDGPDVSEWEASETVELDLAGLRIA